MDEPTFVAAARADVLASDPDEVDAYDRAAPYWHCFLGLERYWRKRGGSKHRLRAALAPLRDASFSFLPWGWASPSPGCPDRLGAAMPSAEESLEPWGTSPAGGRPCWPQQRTGATPLFGLVRSCGAVHVLSPPRAARAGAGLTQGGHSTAA